MDENKSIIYYIDSADRGEMKPESIFMDEEAKQALLEEEADNFIKAVSPPPQLIVTDRATLLKKSRPVTDDDDIPGIVKKLKEANDTAWTNGCGLAAIQIGIPIRLAWLSVEGVELVLVNPEIVEESGPYVVSSEGCLSIPNHYTNVRRAQKIIWTCEGMTDKSEDKGVTTYESGVAFEACGRLARVIQHEIDHMDGILNIEKKYVPSKLGRNEKCECGSNRKYKHCCL